MQIITEFSFRIISLYILHVQKTSDKKIFRKPLFYLYIEKNMNLFEMYFKLQFLEQLFFDFKCFGCSIVQFSALKVGLFQIRLL
jgi:hypothetical protein